ncbi:phosphatase PAP2 family protein [bacterium]|nr:phosphatase PAP2 family protein [bacterium]
MGKSITRKLVTSLWLCSLFLLLLQGVSIAESLDLKVYKEIHDDWRSPLMDDVMDGITTLGSKEFTLGLCLGFTAFGDSSMKATGKLATTSLLTAQTLTVLLKTTVNRRRPEGKTDRYNSSFPSGHTSGAFSLAYVYGEKYPKLKIPVYLFATGVGISRIYLGRHYPSDVLIGAAIGITFGWLTIKFEDWILSLQL